MNWKRGLAASGLSILQPGLGQTYVRGVRLGIFFLLAQSAIVATAILTPVLYRSSGLAVFLIVGITILITSIVHAGWVSLHQAKDSQLPPMPKILFIVALASAGLNFAGNFSGFIFDRLPIRAFKMSSDLGAPTLLEGDRVIADFRAYRTTSPQRGDLIVFEIDLPERVIYSKRVIAIGGDVIESTARGIFVNGEHLSEPYLETPGPDDDHSHDFFPPHPVQARSFFVMGDNRANSYDSREFGDVRREKIRGKILYIYWSPDRSRIGRSVQ